MSVDFNALTAKQKKVYYTIESFIKTRGIPPTVREIGELVGEKTPGAVQGILNRLEQKGVIKRELGMARSIQLVSDESQYAKPVYVPQIKKINSRNINDLLNIYNISAYQPMSRELVDEQGEYFLMEWEDDNMNKYGIQQDDLLLVRRDISAENGDIVLVLYSNHLLLRSYTQDNESGTITLKADFDFLGKESFTKDEIVLVGKVSGKYTRFC